MIDRTLAELDAALAAARVDGRNRRRLVAEAREHLRDATQEGGEADAVRSFGDPSSIARLLAAELATARTRMGTYVAFGALAVTGLAYTAVTILYGIIGWPDIFAGDNAAFGALAGIGIILFPQIAFAAGCLALLRVLRSRRAAALTMGELGVARRRAAVALAAGALTAASWAVWAVEFRAQLAPGRGWVANAILVAAAALIVLLTAAAVLVARSTSPVAVTGTADGIVVDELEPLLRRLGPASRLFDTAHPWRLALAVAGAVGAAALAAGWLGEGDPGSGLVRGVFEAVAVLACFATLGRVLALRR